MIQLVNVYDEPRAYEILWELLLERQPEVNISHRELPLYEQHVNFVNSKPYIAWFLIKADDYVGAIYLTTKREVGLFIFGTEQGKGYGSAALKILKEYFPGPLLANIAPFNYRSQLFFKNEGFQLIQFTYEFK